MKIQFEIKETLAGILDQLLHSDFWITEVEEIDDKRKRIKIRDFAYPQEATAEVSENEILLKTAWSKYTYRLYEVNHVCWCEYTGAYRGLLEQKLLPIITPKENLLDQPVRSSLLGDMHKPNTMDSQPSQPNQEDVSVVPLPVSYQMDQVITKIPPTASPHLRVVKLLEEFLWG